MDALLKDIRYGLRGLLKHPGFTLVAVITLALGIGANSAIFTVVNAVLLRPLPLAAPEQLVFIWQTHPFGKRIGVEQLPGSNADFFDWQEQSNLFEGMSMIDSWGGNLTGGAIPEHVDGAKVSVNLFSLLRAQPMLGRDFNHEQAQPGNERVVILSHGLWQRRFGGDTGIVGQQIQIDGQPFTVQGVMRPGFVFPKDVGLPNYFSFAKTEMWLPIALTAGQRANRGSHHLAVVARLNLAQLWNKLNRNLRGLQNMLRNRIPRNQKTGVPPSTWFMNRLLVLVAEQS